MYVYVDKTTNEVRSVAEKKVVVIDNTDVIEYTGEIPENPTYYYFINGKFVLNEDKQLNNLKQRKIEEIKSKFNETIKAGFECSNGIKMDADITDISKLKAGIDLTVTMGATTLNIRDYENAVHSLTVDEVNSMLVELGENYQTLLKKKWDLEEQVNSATTTEELNAVSWD